MYYWAKHFDEFKERLSLLYQKEWIISHYSGIDSWVISEDNSKTSTLGYEESYYLAQRVCEKIFIDKSSLKRDLNTGEIKEKKSGKLIIDENRFRNIKQLIINWAEYYGLSHEAKFIENAKEITDNLRYLSTSEPGSLLNRIIKFKFKKPSNCILYKISITDKQRYNEKKEEFHKQYSFEKLIDEIDIREELYIINNNELIRNLEKGMADWYTKFKTKAAIPIIGKKNILNSLLKNIMNKELNEIYKDKRKNDIIPNQPYFTSNLEAFDSQRIKVTNEKLKQYGLKFTTEYCFIEY